MINSIIKIASKTIGTLHFPYVDKKFNLDHYFTIEKLIREQSHHFIVGLVKTNGHGTNLLVKIATRDSEIVHAFAHIGIYKGYKHRVIESVGTGIQEISLLSAIGQRDRVIPRAPNIKIIPVKVLDHAVNYCKEIAKRDSKQNIKYDNVHDYSTITYGELCNYNADIKLDCSEVIMQALEHGFRKCNLHSPINRVQRGGKWTWSPLDILKSDIFTTIYDSQDDW